MVELQESHVIPARPRLDSTFQLLVQLLTTLKVQKEREEDIGTTRQREAFLPSILKIRAKPSFSSCFN